MKCAHCQEVHNHRFECGPIKELKTFCGDDDFQLNLSIKRSRKNEKKKP